MGLGLRSQRCQFIMVAGRAGWGDVGGMDEQGSSHHSSQKWRDGIQEEGKMSCPCKDTPP